MGRFSPTVVDHFTNPRNIGQLDGANVRAFVGNPVCGDQILLTARVTGDVVTDLRFQAFGCSASLAVASLLTTVLKGQPVDRAAGLSSGDVEELTGGLSPDQRHVAALAADVAHRLAGNFRSGVNDDDPITCAS
jgi:nitrogen fixation protein NifU and related proteins